MNSEYTKVKLKDICRNVSKTEKNPLENGLERYIGLEHIDPESLKINRWGLIENGISFTKKFEKGQILFGKRRSYQKKAAVAEFDGICSGDILVFEAIEDKIIPEILPYIIQNDKFFDYSVGTSAGSLSPRTNWKYLSEYEVNIPSKFTQIQIVNKLEKIQKNIDLNNELRSKAILYRQKLVDKILFGNIYGNSEEWKTYKIADIVTVSRGISWSKGNEFDCKDNDNLVRVYKIPNVPSNSKYQSNEDKTYITKSSDFEKYLVRDNDLLMVSANGNPSRVGNIVKVKKIEEAVFASFLLKIQANENIHPDLLYYLMISSTVQRKITEGSRGSTGLKNINIPFMKDIKVKIPTLEEQYGIVKILTSIDVNIEQIEENINTLIKLKKYFIDKFINI